MLRLFANFYRVSLWIANCRKHEKGETNLLRRKRNIGQAGEQLLGMEMFGETTRVA